MWLFRMEPAMENSSFSNDGPGILFSIKVWTIIIYDVVLFV